jgi:hypothetical protein
MPLLPNARDKLRVNLERIAAGKRAKLVTIGHLTPVQLAAINKRRVKLGLPEITDEVVFIGHHLYDSRVNKDGYTIDDVIDQLTGAMDSSSIATASEIYTGMENQTPRADCYGNMVFDRVIFECTARKPRPEVRTVIPKGDTNKPKKKEALPVEGLSRNSSDSTG